MECRCLDNQFQQFGAGTVQVLHFEGSVLQALQDVRRLFGTSSHQKVGTGIQLLGSVALAGPVGDDQALETEFATKDVGEQAAALLGVFAVKIVVGCHNGPGLGIPDA